MSLAETPRTTTADRPGTPDAGGSLGRPALDADATGPRPARAHTRIAAAPAHVPPEAGGVGHGTVTGTVTAPTAARWATTGTPRRRTVQPAGAERGGAACPGAGVGS
ncbi:hypothetical protein GCM10018783_14480 [Streptomyces griseosporeus]|nr:hypothetical protein GCM10018783_14480 [Streptomyces griseosporeus]